MSQRKAVRDIQEILKANSMQNKKGNVQQDPRSAIQPVIPTVTITIPEPAAPKPRVRVEYKSVNGWEGCTTILGLALQRVGEELLKEKQGRDKKIIVPDVRLIQRPS